MSAKNTNKPVPGSKPQIEAIITRLAAKYPDARYELDFTTPLELLVATILAAQCTDARVNAVTKTLFQKYRSAADYVKVTQEELAEDVRPTGFFNNKAKAIRTACQYLIDHYNGEVPKTMAELVTLPGVARKTANVILGNAFNVSDGFIVDTHVLRLAQRFGWSSNTDANKVEQDLMKLIPSEHWLSLAHEIILFGRNTCTARKPACVGCILADVCPSEGIVS